MTGGTEVNDSGAKKPTSEDRTRMMAGLIDRELGPSVMVPGPS